MFSVNGNMCFVNGNMLLLKGKFFLGAGDFRGTIKMNLSIDYFVKPKYLDL